MRTGYTALALLPEEGPTHNPGATLAALLESAGATQIITHAAGNSTSGAWEGWRLSLAYSQNADVLQEAQEIADVYGAKRHDRETIARCGSRIELWSEADPEMLHFNDYISMLMQIEAAFPAAILFDDASGVFI